MKNNLSKILILFVAIIFGSMILTSCGSPQQPKDLLSTVKGRGKIIVGVKYDSKPFGFIDKDQQLKGYDVEVAREIAKRIFGDSNAVAFEQVTSSNRIFALTSGSVDMVAATMTITPKRSQIIDFNIPYFEAGQAIMVKKGSKIVSAKDLNDKKVLVVLGSTGEKNVRIMSPRAEILGFRTYTDAFSALRSGRGEALTTDDTILYGFASLDKNYIILGQRYSEEPYGIGFKKAPETQEFQRTVNKIISEMLSDGTIGRLKKKWTSSYGKS